MLRSPLRSGTLCDLLCRCALQALLDETKCVSALPKMIVTGYKELNLIYYFTAGETEVSMAACVAMYAARELCIV